MEKSMAAYAAQDESAMARDLNEHFRSKGIEFIATDTGGSGHNPDVTVKDILTEEPINKFESKRSGVLGRTSVNFESTMNLRAVGNFMKHPSLYPSLSLYSALSNHNWTLMSVVIFRTDHRCLRRPPTNFGIPMNREDASLFVEMF